MPNRRLYLHETIRITGTGAEAYKRHTGTRGAGRRDGGAELVGIWQQCGSTGDWPCVVNLWEMDGWDQWAEILERQYTPASGQSAALRRWWQAAARWRSGGFDRILEPAPYSPTRQELIDRNLRGRAFLQEVATLAPGQAEAYLEAVAARWLRVAARRGLTLVGAYRTTMRDTEAVLLWSFPTLRHFTRHLQDFRATRETRDWIETARTWRTDYRETLLVASPWCVMHPAWRPPKPRAAKQGARVGRRRARRPKPRTAVAKR